MKQSANKFIAVPVIVSALLVSGGVAAQGAETGLKQLSSLANAPLYFEGGDASFTARGAQCNVTLAPAAAEMILGKPGSTARTVRLRFAGANPAAAMAGLDRLPGAANYFLGNDAANWRAGVPLFSKVQVNDVYPGIRVVYYGNQSAQLEYDFLLQPDARPEAISFAVEGADKVRVNAQGDLVLTIGGEQVVQHKPVIYQERNGARKEINGGYRVGKDGSIGFEIAAYDHHLPLVIDPTLSFLTYLGGKKNDYGWSIALDASENVYVAGETLSKGLPTTPGAFGPVYFGGTAAFGDAFVASYTSSGALRFLTYFGGRWDDGALGIAVDPSGNAYVTGFTDSTNFPIMPPGGAIKNSLKDGVARNNNAMHIYPVDAFVSKFDSSGALVYSTYLGGSGRDEGVGIAVDASGSAYVTGLTESTNFPVTTNIAASQVIQYTNGGGADVFIAKLGPQGTNLLYATYLGGTNTEYGEGIAVDSGGNAWVTGFTGSTNFPVVNPIVDSIGHSYTNLSKKTNYTVRVDAFLSKISADGSTLLSSTYLGGTNDDVGVHVTTDSADNAYVTGFTSSKDFPTNVITTPQSSATNFLTHVFVTEVDPSGTLLYSTQFGGNRFDQGAGIAVDTNGLIYVTGSTTSTNFFATDSFTDLRNTNVLARQPARGTNDVFVAVLSPQATSFETNCVLLGARGSDDVHGIAITPDGSVAYIVGTTTSPTNFATTNAAQPTFGGHGQYSDAFVGRIQLVP